MFASGVPPIPFKMALFQRGCGAFDASAFRCYTQEGMAIRVEPRMAINTPKQIRSGKSARPATILVVDDSKENRELYRATLQDKGYEVLSAESGENALQLCRTHKGLINLVVMDVIMPGMSGLKLATKLLPLRPNLKVLFVSAFMQHRAVQSGLRSIDGYLSKPFPAEQLITKIREMLAS